MTWDTSVHTFMEKLDDGELTKLDLLKLMLDGLMVKEPDHDLSFAVKVVAAVKNLMDSGPDEFGVKGHNFETSLRWMVNATKKFNKKKEEEFRQKHSTLIESARAVTRDLNTILESSKNNLNDTSNKIVNQITWRLRQEGYLEASDNISSATYKTLNEDVKGELSVLLGDLSEVLDQFDEADVGTFESEPE